MGEELVRAARERTRSDIEAWLSNFPVTVAVAYTTADAVVGVVGEELRALVASPERFSGDSPDAFRRAVRWSVLRGRQHALRLLVGRDPVRGYLNRVPEDERFLLWCSYNGRMSLRELGRLLRPPEASAELPEAEVRGRLLAAFRRLLAVMPKRPGAGPDEFAFPPPEPLVRRL